MNGLEMARERLTDDGEPPLSFEQWRALAPRLSGREADEREALLAAAKIEPARWDRADGYWSLTLAAECARGERARAEDFGRACAEEQESRKKASSIRADDTWPEGIAPPALAETAPSGATLSREGGEAVSREEAPALPVLASRGTPAELPALVLRGEAPEPPGLVLRGEVPELAAVVSRVPVAVPTFLQAGRGHGQSAAVAAGPSGSPPTVARSEPPLPGWVSAPGALAPAAGPPAGQNQATLEVSPTAIRAAERAVPFAPRPPGATAPPLPPRPASLSAQSGATVALAAFPFPPGLAPAQRNPAATPGSAAAERATGQDLRDPTATVALDPEVIARMLAGKLPIPP